MKLVRASIVAYRVQMDSSGRELESFIYLITIELEIKGPSNN